MTSTRPTFLTNIFDPFSRPTVASSQTSLRFHLIILKFRTSRSHPKIFGNVYWKNLKSNSAAVPDNFFSFFPLHFIIYFISTWLVVPIHFTYSANLSPRNFLTKFHPSHSRMFSYTPHPQRLVVLNLQTLEHRRLIADSITCVLTL